jgi:hypothetical protein
MVSWFKRTQDDASVSCDQCGWSGFGRDLEPDYESSYLLVRCCPECDRHLELATYPDDAEIRRFAARGNAEAQRMMANVELQASRAKLPVAEDVSDLPDLPAGAGRVVAISVEGERDKDDPMAPWLSVRCDGVELWREPAFWEDSAGGHRLMNLIWKRYAGAIDRISLEGGALDYFAGDRLRAAYDFLALQDAPGEE